MHETVFGKVLEMNPNFSLKNPKISKFVLNKQLKICVYAYNKLVSKIHINYILKFNLGLMKGYYKSYDSSTVKTGKLLKNGYGIYGGSGFEFRG